MESILSRLLKYDIPPLNVQISNITIKCDKPITINGKEACDGGFEIIGKDLDQEILIMAQLNDIGTSAMNFKYQTKNGNISPIFNLDYLEGKTLLNALKLATSSQPLKMQINRYNGSITFTNTFT